VLLADRERRPAFRRRTVAVARVGQGDGELEHGPQDAFGLAGGAEHGQRLIEVPNRRGQVPPEQFRGAAQAGSEGGRRVIAQLRRHLIALGQPLLRRRTVALQQGHPGGHPQRTRSMPGPIARQRERAVEPVPALAQESVHVPVVAQRDGEPE
jgi:hypothetical protein